jgi:hypothetical protein
MSWLHPLTVAWFLPSVEWLSACRAVTRLPRQHPASWQRVLLTEFENPALRLHVVVLRKQFESHLRAHRRDASPDQNARRSAAPSLFWVDTVLIRRVLRAIKPDLVHAWGTEQGAALVANRLGYPRVATVQGLIWWYTQVSPPT